MVQTPEITQRVHHATDEEKLASTGIMGPTADIQDEKTEKMEPECNKVPVKKQPTIEKSIVDGMFAFKYLLIGLKTPMFRVFRLLASLPGCAEQIKQINKVKS